MVNYVDHNPLTRQANDAFNGTSISVVKFSARDNPYMIPIIVFKIIVTSHRKNIYLFFLLTFGPLMFHIYTVQSKQNIPYWKSPHR